MSQEKREEVAKTPKERCGCTISPTRPRPSMNVAEGFPVAMYTYPNTKSIQSLYTVWKKKTIMILLLKIKKGSELCISRTLGLTGPARALLADKGRFITQAFCVLEIEADSA